MRSSSLLPPKAVRQISPRGLAGGTIPGDAGMLPTSSITLLDFAFAFLLVIVFCEALRIVVVGLKNLQFPPDDHALDKNIPTETLTKPDGT
jgi:hypothetical protein